MPNDTNLSVGVVIDVSQLGPATTEVSNSVKEMASRISAAFGSIEKAPEGVRNAFLVLQNASRQSGDIVTESARAIERALQDAGASAEEFGTQAEEGMGRASLGANNARIAFSGLTRELGLTGNRALSSFIAQSESLGPILSTAFSGIAIVGFIELAVQAAEKISKFISDTLIFTQAEQDAYNQLVKDNAAIAENEEQHKKNLQEISLIGKSAAEQDRLRAQYAKEDSTSKSKQVEQANLETAAQREKLQVLYQQRDALATQPQFNTAGKSVFPSEASKSLQDVNAQIAEGETNLNRLGSRFKELGSEATLAADHVVASTDRMNAAISKANAEQARRDTREEGEASKEAAREELEEFDRTMEAKKAGRREEAELDKEAALEELRAMKEADQAAKEERRQDERLSRESALEELRQVTEVAAAKKKAAEEAQREAKETLTKETESLEQIVNGPLNQFVRGWVSGTENMRVAFAKFGAGLLSNIIDTLAKAATHWAEYHLLTEVLQQSSMARQIAEFVSGEGTKRAIQSASNIAQVQGSAGVGGAAAFASVLSALPFPFNVAIAPGVASAEVAQIEGIGAVAAFEGGGLVPGTGLAMLHGGEMVLPQSISKHVQETAAGGGGGGNSAHIHFHGNGSSAIGREQMNQVKKELTSHLRNIGFLRK